MSPSFWHGGLAGVLSCVLMFPNAAWAGRGPAALPAPAAVVQPGSVVALMAPPAATDVVDMDEVKRIYDEGKARYDTFDYAGAIEAWTRAYGMLPATEENRGIRNDLAYNIATSQEKAYDLDQDPTHLRQARALLQRFVDEYKALYAPTPEGRAEVDQVMARIAELDRRIATTQSRPGSAAQPTPAPAAAAPARQPGPPSERQQIRTMLRNDPELSSQYRRAKGMIIGGGVSLGAGALLGVIALRVGLGNALWRDDRQRGAAAGLGVASVGGLVTGAVLMGVGFSRRNQAVDAARARVRVGTNLQSNAGGLTLVGRF